MAGPLDDIDLCNNGQTDLIHLSADNDQFFFRSLDQELDLNQTFDFLDENVDKDNRDGNLGNFRYNPNGNLSCSINWPDGNPMNCPNESFARKSPLFQDQETDALCQETTTEDRVREKEQIRKERNKQSAKKSREKKIHEFACSKEKNELLKEQHRVLNNAVRDLQKKSDILSHMTAYLDRNFGRTSNDPSCNSIGENSSFSDSDSSSNIPVCQSIPLASTHWPRSNPVMWDGQRQMEPMSDARNAVTRRNHPPEHYTSQESVEIITSGVGRNFTTNRSSSLDKSGFCFEQFGDLSRFTSPSTQLSCGDGSTKRRESLSCYHVEEHNKVMGPPAKRFKTEDGNASPWCVRQDNVNLEGLFN